MPHASYRRRTHPQRSIRRDNLGPQRAANILLAPRPPLLVPALAQRPQRLVEMLVEIDVVCEFRSWRAHQGIQLAAQLGAVLVEREIVDVVAKGVFQLVADGRDAEDDVGGRDGAGDCDPAKLVVELEWEQVDVEEDDLGDQDVVADGEGGGEDSFRVAGGVGHAGEGVHCGGR